MTQAQKIAAILLFGDRITPDAINTIRLFRAEMGLSFTEAIDVTANEFRRRGWTIPNWIEERTGRIV
jgi:hypothetical protein